MEKVNGHAPFFSNFMPVFQLTSGWIKPLRVGGHAQFSALLPFIFIRYYSSLFSFSLRYSFALQSKTKRSSIEHLSKTYRRPIEDLSKTYRRPIEHLSKTYRSDHTAILFYTPTLFVCYTLFPKLHGLDIRTRRDGEEINSRREGRERDTLQRASSNIVETNRRETCAVSRTERDRDIRSISKER